MPSVRYFNQTAPFWDFVASMEEQGSAHPFFGGANRGEASDNENERPNPWSEGWGGFPWGPLAHRGRHGGPHPPPPPPPPGHEGPPPPPPAEGDSEPEAGPSDENQAGPGGRRGRREHHHHHQHQQGGPWRGHHGMGGRGGHFGRGRGRGPRFHPYAMGPFGGLAEMFQNQFFNPDNTDARAAANDHDEFTPDVDVFDTPEAFIVHVSLPGAKKEDLGVSWDADKSELAIAGVVHRPGDEELLKTLALDERKVGAFDRKVRLGSRANPAQIDVEAIAARMEDGVLRVEVPKLDAGYVEIKKVDIE